MIKELWRVIPDSFRRNTISVAMTIFLRALLNFVGIATLLPILLLIISSGDITSTGYLNRIYNLLGCSNYTEFVVAICVAVVAIIVIKNITVLYLYRFERDYIFNLYRYLSQRLFKVYFKRGLNYVKRHNSATLTRNINSVSLMFVAGVLKPIASIFSEGLLLILITVALAIYNPLAAVIVALIFAPIATIFYLLMRRRLHDIGESENDIQRVKNRIVAETFKGYVDIEMADAFELMLRRFDEAMNSIVALRKRHATLVMLPQIFSEVGLSVGLVILVLLGHSFSGSDIALLFGIFAVAAVRLIPSLRNIMTSWSTIRFNRYTIDTLCDIDVKEDVKQSNYDATSLNFERTLELRNLSFKFDDSETATINNLSIEIKKGECIGVRGSSGVGKTTLFNLMLGFYAPTSGGIYVDDVKLDESNIAKWQKQIGYVSQSVFIADMTLLENIALGSSVEEIDYERVNEVIRLANLEEFVASLPDGLNSRIGEQGCRISGGQRQRIGIARALYKNVDILLFDEATSSLDTKTEENINSAIGRLSTENHALTIVVIAHRESSLEYCNRIITLE